MSCLVLLLSGVMSVSTTRAEQPSHFSLHGSDSDITAEIHFIELKWLEWHDHMVMNIDIR